LAKTTLWCTNIILLLQKTGKRGRKPTIVIVVSHITTISGESSQKLSVTGERFSSRCGVYLAISRKDKSIKQKTKSGESEEKDTTFSASGKRQKYSLAKVPPFDYTFAGFEVSCSRRPCGNMHNPRKDDRQTVQSVLPVPATVASDDDHCTVYKTTCEIAWKVDLLHSIR
jgi:hypothetical protein